ncbi:hypothetical protein ACHHYP_08729 [Achlya hypogyna]|uniref:Uncharacterized protein n=1 Tax=Achlya hypogyna TaxID=1202772 RepID=A0A1V9ZK51_ACHHY|nr:hypothetical protein ACHHYP_08729 [Achlya hypogyna]
MASNIPDTLRCKYTYKPCFNPRTTKKNGDLHMLCAFHRDRANEVQKTHAKKRKQLKALEQRVLMDTSAHEVGGMDPLELQYLEALLREYDVARAVASSTTTETTMTDEEYAILFELF